MAAEIYLKIGAAIRSRREALGLTQAVLAKRAGLVRTSITMIERGSQAILVHQLVDLASALRTTPSELLPIGHQGRPSESVSDGPNEDVMRLLADLEKTVGRITR